VDSVHRFAWENNTWLHNQRVLMPKDSLERNREFTVLNWDASDAEWQIASKTVYFYYTPTTPFDSTVYLGWSQPDDSALVTGYNVVEYDSAGYPSVSNSYTINFGGPQPIAQPIYRIYYHNYVGPFAARFTKEYQWSVVDSAFELYQHTYNEYDSLNRLVDYVEWEFTSATDSVRSYTIDRTYSPMGNTLTRLDSIRYTELIFRNYSRYTYGVYATPEGLKELEDSIYSLNTNYPDTPLYNFASLSVYHVALAVCPIPPSSIRIQHLPWRTPTGHSVTVHFTRI
jgi:hypothetical protein